MDVTKVEASKWYTELKNNTQQRRSTSSRKRYNFRKNKKSTSNE